MKVKKSEIFWTSILALALIIIRYIVGLELFLMLWLVIGSVISLLKLSSTSGHVTIQDKNITIEISLWLFLFPITWLLLIITIIDISFGYFYKKVIKPFNDKLNGENN